MAKRVSQPFRNGVPELLILRLLRDKEMYGYQLIQAVQNATGSALELGEGSAYPVLHALERNGHLSSKRKLVGSRARVYYRITRSGRRRLKELTAEWEKVAGAVSGLLAGES